MACRRRKRDFMFTASTPPHVDLVIESRPSQGKVWGPGDTIRGHVAIELFNSLSLKSITVNLKGVSRVRLADQDDGTARNKRETSSFHESIDLVDVPIQVFPTPQLTSALGSRDLTMQVGLHEYPFTLVWPETVQESAGNLWAGKPLPSSFEISQGSDASVSYWVECLIKVPGFFSRNIRETLPMIFLAAKQHSTHKTSKTYVQRPLTLKIYEQESEGWMDYTLRAMGLPTHSSELHLAARLTHPTIGIPSPVDGGYPVSDHIGAQLLLLDPPGAQTSSKEKRQSGDLIVRSLTIDLNAVIVVHGRDGERTLRNTINLVNKRRIRHVVDVSGGEVDLKPLIADEMVPESIVPTFAIPHVTVQYELSLTVQVSSIAGNPVVPVRATATKSLNVYSTKSGPVSTGSAASADQPPPYDPGQSAPPCMNEKVQY